VLKDYMIAEKVSIKVFFCHRGNVAKLDLFCKQNIPFVFKLPFLV